MNDERRTDDLGPHGRGKPWRREILAVAALLFMVLGAYAIDRQNVADANRVKILDGIESNCTLLVDGEIEDNQRGKLLVEITAQLLIASAASDDPQAETFIEDVRPLLNKVDIGPTTDCAALRGEVEEALQ